MNLLTDLLQYSPTALFHKIKGGSEWPEELGAEGDVLSHLGAFDILGYHVFLFDRGSFSVLANTAVRGCRESAEGFTTPKSFSSRSAITSFIHSTTVSTNLNICSLTFTQRP